MVLEDSLADGGPLDLAGALADEQERRLAHQPFDLVLLGVAATAVDAEGLLGHLEAPLGCEQLGHARFDVVAGAGVLQPGRVDHHEVGRLDLGAHLGDLEGDGGSFGHLPVVLGLLHEEGREVAVRFVRTFLGPHEGGHQVGGAAVGQPHLLAVDDVGVTVPDGFRPDRGHIGTEFRFGHREGAAHLAGDHLRQVARPLLRGAVLGDHGQAAAPAFPVVEDRAAVPRQEDHHQVGFRGLPQLHLPRVRTPGPTSGQRPDQAGSAARRPRGHPRVEPLPPLRDLLRRARHRRRPPHRGSPAVPPNSRPTPSTTPRTPPCSSTPTGSPWSNSSWNWAYRTSGRSW